MAYSPSGEWLGGQIDPLHVRGRQSNIYFFYMRIDLNSQKRTFLLFCPPDWLHSHDVQGVYRKTQKVKEDSWMDVMFWTSGVHTRTSIMLSIIFEPGTSLKTKQSVRGQDALNCCLVVQLTEHGHASYYPVVFWFVRGHLDWQHVVGWMSRGRESPATGAGLVHCGHSKTRGFSKKSKYQ